MPRRRLFFLVTGLVVLVAIAVTLLTTLPQLRSPSKLPSEVKQNLSSSELGQVSAQIMKPGRAITTMVGPGEAKWWGVETRFVQNWQLQNRWNDLPVKPQTIGFTLFYSAETPSQRFATPALFMQFASTAAAQQTVEAFNTGELKSSSYQYQALRLGKNLVLVPTTVYTDQVFNHTQDFKEPAAVKAAPQEGYWVVNAAALDAYVKRDQAAKDRSIYLGAVRALGFDTSAASGAWYAHSADGLHWQGQLANGANTPLWNSSKVNPTAFYHTLASAAKKIGAPTPEQIEKAQSEATTPDSTSTFFFTVEPRQAVIAEYFAIATGGKVTGKLTELQTSKPVKVTAPADKDKVVYTVEPNVWVDAFLRPDSGDFWYLFGFKQATLTFYKSDTNRLDITLLPMS